MISAFYKPQYDTKAPQRNDTWRPAPRIADIQPRRLTQVSMGYVPDGLSKE